MCGPQGAPGRAKETASTWASFRRQSIMIRKHHFSVCRRLQQQFALEAQSPTTRAMGGGPGSDLINVLFHTPVSPDVCITALAA